jgi:hypothetical protein
MVVLALAGCAMEADDVEVDVTGAELGGHRVGPDLTRSGSRLKARYATRHDFRSALGFHDRSLDLDCSFELAKTGEYRCFPSLVDWEYFTDPTCTDEPVRVESLDGPALAAGTLTSAFTFELEDINASKYAGYEIVEEIANTTVYWHALGLCEAETLSGVRLYRLKPVDSSTFVGGTFRLDRVGGDRIFAQTVHGDDGSRAHVAKNTGMYYDVVLGQTVAPQTTRESSTLDREVIWAPTSPDPMWISHSARFSDASCTKAAVEIGLGPDLVVAPGTVIGTSELQACRTYRTTYAKLDPAPLDVSYVADGGTCAPGEPDEYNQYFRLGRAVRRHEYVTGTLRLGGRGRIAPYELRSSDGSVVSVGLGFHDRALDRNCALIFHGDNDETMGCELFDYPATAFEMQTLNYLDPECTQPVIGGQGNLAAEACFTGTFESYLRNQPAGETASVTVFRGGPRLTTPDAPVPLYFRNEVGGTCYPGGEGQAYAITSQTEVSIAELEVVGGGRGHGRASRAALRAPSAAGRAPRSPSRIAAPSTPRAAALWSSAQRR